MINYKVLKEAGITPKKIKKINNSYLIDTGDYKYIVKNKDEKLDKKFNYLLSRGFNYFPESFSVNNYDIFKYIEGGEISYEEKLYELVDLISLLHTKTTRYKNIDIDDYKMIYEDLDKKIEDLTNYYNSLNDLIDREIYMSPSHFLLVLNISKVYSALTFCKKELDNWYELIKNNPKQRVAYIHNNLGVDHVIRGDNPYLISWSRSKVDLPIYDLIDLYNKTKDEIDFDILLNSYQKRYPLKQEELKLFFINISIPKKISFGEDEYENTKEVKKMLNVLKKGDKLINPYYKK